VRVLLPSGERGYVILAVSYGGF